MPSQQREIVRAEIFLARAGFRAFGTGRTWPDFLHTRPGGD